MPKQQKQHPELLQPQSSLRLCLPSGRSGFDPLPRLAVKEYSAPLGHPRTWPVPSWITGAKSPILQYIAKAAAVSGNCRFSATVKIIGTAIQMFDEQAGLAIRERHLPAPALCRIGFRYGTGVDAANPALCAAARQTRGYASGTTLAHDSRSH